MSSNATCSVAGCTNPSKTRGWCGTHYARWLRNGHTDLQERIIASCSVDGCELRVKAKGLCDKHYLRNRLYGRLGRQYHRSADVVAFLKQLVNSPPTGECVIWPFARRADGYGQIETMGESLAHRVACRLAHGEPSDGAPLALHRCGKGHLGCVAPWHLYWGDHTANQRDREVHGTANIGAANPMAKLDDEVVRSIRASASPNTQEALKHGVSPATISSIRNWKTWKHVA
jgi:hypothetical protein